MLMPILLNFHVGADIDKNNDRAFSEHEGQPEEIQTILDQYNIENVTPQQAIGLFKRGRQYLEAEVRGFYGEVQRKPLGPLPGENHSSPSPSQG